jgi:hypothetical protein
MTNESVTRKKPHQQIGRVPTYAARAMSRPLWMIRRFGSIVVLEAACR